MRAGLLSGFEGKIFLFSSLDFVELEKYFIDRAEEEEILVENDREKWLFTGHDNAHTANVSPQSVH